MGGGTKGPEEKGSCLEEAGEEAEEGDRRRRGRGTEGAWGRGGEKTQESRYT